MKMLDSKVNCLFKSELKLNLWYHTEPKDNFSIKEVSLTTLPFNQTHSPQYHTQKIEASRSEENLPCREHCCQITTHD